MTEREEAHLGRATLLVAISACCFGSIPILVLLATRDAALSAVLVWRYALGAVLLALAAGPTRLRVPLRPAMALIVLGGGLQAILTFLSLSALRFVPAATLSFLFYTYPAWVAVLAVIRRSERIDRGRAVALGLSLAGIAIMVGSPWSGVIHPVGVVLALSAGFLYAIYVPMIGRLQRGIPPAAVAVCVTFGAAVAFLIGAAMAGEMAVRFAPSVWAVIGTLAAVSTALAFILFLRGLAALGPVRTAIVSTIEPFWTAVLGALVLGQRVTVATVAGGTLIAAAVWLLQRPPPAMERTVSATVE